MQMRLASSIIVKREKLVVAETYDIAIIGGGMVGLAFACGLSTMQLAKQLKVVIIDSNPTLKSTVHFKKDELPDPRVSTVTPATISFLKEVGAWEYVEQQRHAFFNQMQVLFNTNAFLVYIWENNAGICVVENKVLCSSLLSSLQECPMDDQSAVASSDSISEWSNLSSAVKLGLSDGQSLYAKLVVGSDGAKSQVREIAGIKTTGWNYTQSAVICTVEHSIENHCAWQRFLPSGPIALLPIGDRFSNIVWTMTPKESSNHKSMSKDDFVKAVNHALDYGYGSHPKMSFLDEYIRRISSISGQGTVSMAEPFEVPPIVTDLVSERMAFPLSLRHASEYASKRVVLIGDAAHAVHPLAGQGVNLGFSDAAALSKVINEGLQAGADIGEISLLKKYEKERMAANVTMMAILDGFQKAYSVDLGPLNFLRAAAFHGAQYIAPLKKNIISYAMGEQKWPLFL
ncbi:Zeaxanthin epoxidase, chloroplastic [Apostasia shenzhenica]|uniref:Ubiquinone biosynthesis monooxygenase COQ6, mitochondrial n=1 Tax=Apostasia shenzhenica TaxID=1088818 RepID=A0A2I0AHT5_9ASPA|nr:Zeaxanthin epoxidase, chloroplastic [Apostasia shenzhenica]